MNHTHIPVFWFPFPISSHVLLSHFLAFYILFPFFFFFFSFSFFLLLFCCPIICADLTDITPAPLVQACQPPATPKTDSASRPYPQGSTWGGGGGGGGGGSRMHSDADVFSTLSAKSVIYFKFSSGRIMKLLRKPLERSCLGPVNKILAMSFQSGLWRLPAPKQHPTHRYLYLPPSCPPRVYILECIFGVR